MSANGTERVICCSDDDKLELLSQYSGFCFDLDGTIWKGNSLIPGAKEVLELLRKMGKQLFFVTNNSSRSRASYHAKMTKLGLDVQQSEIYGSSYAAAMFLQSHRITKVYCVGEAGMVEELQAAGITALGVPQTAVMAVVVGLDRAVNYYKLQTAMAYLRSRRTIFVATNTDSHGNLASSQDWAGAGTMVGAVSAASEMEPFVVGKPNSTLMDLITKDSGLSPSQLCVVGDRLDTDILWAKTCGAGGLLVLTGCTSEDQLKEDKPAVQSVLPLKYVESIGDLLSIKDKVSTLQSSSWASESCTIS